MICDRQRCVMNDIGKVLHLDNTEITQQQERECIESESVLWYKYFDFTLKSGTFGKHLIGLTCKSVYFFATRRLFQESISTKSQSNFLKTFNLPCHSSNKYSTGYCRLSREELAVGVFQSDVIWCNDCEY